MARESPNPQFAFSDPGHVARYAEGPPRMVPGFFDMHRMTTRLLAERVPDRGCVLVVGAGGGLELKTFAQAQPSWTFDGVDPSAEMLKLAKMTLGAHAARATLHEGYIDAAPDGPFDAAACLLTFHFVRLDERRRTVAEVRRRLKPGALWLSRYFAFSGIEVTDSTRAAIISQLTILDPEADEAVLRDAGFSNVTQFYQGFVFRGWVAYA